MKKFISLLIVAAAILSLLSSCSIRRESVKLEKAEDMGKYEEYLAKVEYAADYMPQPNECGDYTSATVTYKKKLMLLFESYSVGLFLSYDNAEYNKQKELILADYNFLTSDSAESDPDASVGGYSIRLADKEYPLQTYKMGLLVGINDSENKICYLFYYDLDLDVLDDLDSYVEEFFFFP